MNKLAMIGLGRTRSILPFVREGKKPLFDTVALRCRPEEEEALHNSGIKVLLLEEIAGKEPELPLPALRERMAEAVLGSVESGRAAACLFPGRPWSGDGLFQELRRRAEMVKQDLQIIPGEDLCALAMEFLPEVSAKIDFSRGITCLDALALDELREPPRGELLVAHPGGGLILQKNRELLLALYPPRHQVDFFQFDKEGRFCPLGSASLEEVDQVDGLHGWTFLRIPPRPYYYLGDMAYVMKRLRSPEGCPWDREQDHLTLRPYLVEETYEVLEAIDNDEPAQLCEELGDLLLQILFHSQLAVEKGHFHLWQVIDGITRKIYRRHPHVFQQEKAGNAREVSHIWQQIKEKEKGREKKGRFSLPAGFPALLRAQKVQKKAADLGFDWPDQGGAVEKIFEELAEFREAVESGRQENIDEEMGDLFFSLVNAARFLGVDAETSLNRTVEKFIRRFKYIDEQVQSRGGNYRDFTLEDLDAWWEEAKMKEKEAAGKPGDGIRDSK